MRRPLSPIFSFSPVFVLFSFCILLSQCQEFLSPSLQPLPFPCALAKPIEDSEGTSLKLGQVPMEEGMEEGAAKLEEAMSDLVRWMKENGAKGIGTEQFPLQYYVLQADEPAHRSQKKQHGDQTNDSSESLTVTTSSSGSKAGSSGSEAGSSGSEAGSSGSEAGSSGSKTCAAGSSLESTDRVCAGTPPTGSTTAAEAAAVGEDEEGQKAAAAKRPRAVATRAEIGFRATRSIQPDELTLRIPSFFQISSDRLAEEEPNLLPYALTEKKETSWTGFTVIAAWMLRERAKGNASVWAPFLRLLPSYVPLPVMFTDSLLKELEYDYMIDEVGHHRKAFDREYRRSKSKRIAKASRSEFFWALSVVVSRCFGSYHASRVQQMAAMYAAAVPTYLGGDVSTNEADKAEALAEAEKLLAQIGVSVKEVMAEEEAAAEAAVAAAAAAEESKGEGGEGEGKGAGEEDAEGPKNSRFSSPVMVVPYADLLNHSPRANLFWEVDGTDFVFRGIKDIPQGAPLTVSYGPKTNDEFFMSYGFIPARNDHDNFLLFDRLDEIIAFFAEAVDMPGKAWTREKEIGAVLVAEEAEVAAQAEQEREEHAPFHMPAGGLRGSSSYFAWSWGKVEPKLIAVFTALWLHWKGIEKDLNYSQIAKAATAYGLMSPTETNCTMMAEWLPPLIVEAMGMAAQAVRKRAQGLMQRFTSTAETDRQRLMQLVWCRGGDWEAVEEEDELEAREADPEGVAAADEALEKLTNSGLVTVHDDVDELAAMVEGRGGEGEGRGGEAGDSSDASDGDKRKGADGRDNGGHRSVVSDESLGEEKGNDVDEGGEETEGEAEEEEEATFSESACTEEVMRYGQEMELILRYRMKKKQVLQETEDRMSWTCDPEFEPYRQAILHGKAFPESELVKETSGSDESQGVLVDQ